jgi:hypothetical protein
MKHSEAWGTALILLAAPCAWAYQAINEAYWAGAREGMLLYIGIPADSIANWFLIAALLSGAVGLLLLVPALIGRIHRKVPRRIVGWTTGVADGQSVLVTQDGFDGDTVDIYTQHDELHYKRVRSAPEISGWPRVKDQNCRLDSAGDELRLICGEKRLVVEEEEPA